MNSSEQMLENLHLPDLPLPDKEALEHSQRLCHRIREDILQNGYISFSRFMQMALYEPGLGYYSAGTRKFGHAGDYITAPELSPLFTKCLARQCLQVLTEIRQAEILEIGPGSGRMMCDLLMFLEEKNTLPEKYLVLETSADLRNRQQKLVSEEIPQLENRIVWLDQMPDKPVNGLIIANEVLDAMPVNRLILQSEGIYESGVGLNDDKFVCVNRPLSENLQKQAELILGENIHELPIGYRTELNELIIPWVQSLSGIMARGLMLLIDYGYPRHEYYHPQRSDGTLICHYRHHAHNNPFLYPGLQDITASVDFTAVAEAGASAGMQVSGYTTQAHFLMNCGLGEIMNDNNLTTEMDRAESARQIRILTLPAEMGERFKVIALTKNLQVPLIGFKSFDQRQRL